MKEIEMTEQLKVGDTIYKFDTNRRVYNKADGIGGQVIFREHFTPHQIMDETKLSWIVGPDYAKLKVNKKTMTTASFGGMSGYRFYTDKGKEDRIFENNHRHKICRLVESCSADKLKQIAAIVDYET